MAQIEVKVRKISVEVHPNADALELANVFGFQAIVRKGQFQTGDLCIYIPSQSIVPEKLLKHIGLEGKLAGKEKNRVKPVKLRGILSEGIVIGFDGLQELYPDKQLPTIEEGTDFQEFLEITKWIPPVPTQFSGKWLVPDDLDHFRTYTDIENIKRYPSVIQEGEMIVATEKLHGTLFLGTLIGDKFYVSSKGISGHQHALAEDEKNIYWRIAKQFEIEEKIKNLVSEWNMKWIIADMSHMQSPPFDIIKEFTIFGEITGVQDLKYGSTNEQPFSFYVFDIRINGKYIPYDSMKYIAGKLQLQTVPMLYQGASISEALKFTDGVTTINGASHIREGIVIRPMRERTDVELGRVILKSVSEHYLTRKGDVTEFN